MLCIFRRTLHLVGHPCLFLSLCPTKRTSVRTSTFYFHGGQVDLFLNGFESRVSLSLVLDRITTETGNISVTRESFFTEGEKNRTCVTRNHQSHPSKEKNLTLNRNILNSEVGD